MPARFSSTDLRSFFYGGFDTFRWDLLGFGFCRVWMSFCLFFASASTALFAGAKSNESFLLLTATTFMVLFFIIFRKTLKGEKARGLIIRFTILTGIIGCCCSLLDLWLGSPILLYIGFSLLGISAGLLQVLWGAKFADLPLISSIAYCLYAMLVASILAVFAYPLSHDGKMVSLVFLPLFAITLYFQKPDKQKEDSDSGHSLPVDDSSQVVDNLGKDLKRLVVGLVFARFLFGLMFNLVLMFVNTETDSSDAAHFVSASLAVLIILVVLFIKRDKFDPVSVYRAVLPITVAGFVLLYLCSSWGFPLSSSLMSLGYKLFDLVLWILLIKIAHTRPLWSYRIFLFAVCANFLGMGLGRLLAIILYGSVKFSDILTTIVLVSSLLIVITTVILLPERKVTALWKNEPSGSFENSTLNSLQVDQGFSDQKLQLLAASFRLTERETDVLLLLARGRTQLAIAKKLSIAKGTVHTHVIHIYQKFGVNSQEELIQLVEDDAD